MDYIYQEPFENMFSADSEYRFFCRLNFESFDYASAESVSFEVQTDDGNNKVFKIK